jgi:hypothetical protein
MWSERTVSTLKAGFLDGMIRPGTSLAVGEVADTGLSAFSRLEQVDLSTGMASRGSIVFAYNQLVTIGSSLAYVEPRSEVVEANGDEAPVTAANSEAEEIRPLDKSSPTVQAARHLSITLPDSVAPRSPAQSSIWAGELGRVVLLSTTTGKVLQSIDLPDQDARFTVSISGSMLYAIANSVGTYPIELYAISLPSDKVVGARAIEGVGGYAIAVPDGVWVSYRTGMLGSAELLSYPHLTRLSPTPPHSAGDRPLPGTSQAMGIEVTVTGRTTWLTDLAGIACVDTATGRLGVDHLLNKNEAGLSILGSVGRHLYAVTQASPNGTRIVQVQVPKKCWF